jgi:antitoxin component of MazEF toxin-antitoxin module
MKRKLVQAGSSLAVTLPAEVVHEFRLSKGQEVDVSIHPVTGAVIIRPGIRLFDDGATTSAFSKKVKGLLGRRARLYESLAR